MTDIKTVLFDLGNVLAYIDFDAFWRNLGFFQPETIAPFKDGYTFWTRKYETGHVKTQEYLNGLQSVFQNKFTTGQLVQAFASIILTPVEGMADLAKRVSQSCQTALVSNTNEIHYALSMKQFEVMNILHKHYMSYQLQVMKPAPGFYDAIIKDQKTAPSSLVFIDDLENNLQGAKSAGMQTILFKNPAQLETELKKFGVL